MDPQEVKSMTLEEADQLLLRAYAIVVSKDIEAARRMWLELLTVPVEHSILPARELIRGFRPSLVESRPVLSRMYMASKPFGGLPEWVEALEKARKKRMDGGS